MPTTGSTSTGYAHFIIIVIICSSSLQQPSWKRVWSGTKSAGVSFLTIYERPAACLSVMHGAFPERAAYRMPFGVSIDFFLPCL